MRCIELPPKKAVIKLTGRYVFRLFNKLLMQCTVVGTHLVKAWRIAPDQKMKEKEYWAKETNNWTI